MGRDIIQLENAVSIISQEYLLKFTSEYGIPEGLHPELPGPEETIMDFSAGKVDVYTKFFEFANFRIPISQFLFDILGFYQIHLSQLSVIGAAKVDEKIFPTVMDWRTSAQNDGMPAANLYFAMDVTSLDTHHMDLFNFISVVNPTKSCDRYGGCGRDVRILRDTVHHREVAARLCQRIPASNNYRWGGAEEQVRDEVAYEIPPTGNALATWVALETGLEKEVAAI
uniref:Transposase (Putative), gypsy type n=1 Tax=Tanacetum cinerariifolium TaxID=118510 RepID=A0A699JL23_TANCI|nr:transposase (putative), gypsy type [Tanacetum cinerariifolium]